MIGASLFVTSARGLLLVFGVFATWGALFSIFMAPQVIRMDMREDLAHLELLKTWPDSRRRSAARRDPLAQLRRDRSRLGVRAAGEVLSLSSLSRIPVENRGAAWLSFLVLVPGAGAGAYTMHNAVAVIFPGWVPLGPSRPRGVDAVGQRLIVLLANWIGLLLALLPGIAVDGGAVAVPASGGRAVGAPSRRAAHDVDRRGGDADRDRVAGSGFREAGRDERGTARLIDR